MSIRSWPEEDLGIGQVIGRVARLARTETGWDQRQLAARVGASQSAIARLESGRSVHLDVGLVSAVFRKLGVRLSFDLNTIGLADRRGQRNLVHAACAAYTKRRLERSGWEVELEVEVGDGRGRGWIDLLAFRRADRALLVGEVKTEIRDLGGILRTIGWYERAAWTASRSRGWRPVHRSRLLILLDTIENDASVQANVQLLREAVPARGWRLQEWLSTPGGESIRGLGLIDPRSRRLDWLRPTRLEGRRSPSAFADYRDAAHALGRRRTSSAPRPRGPPRGRRPSFRSRAR